MIKYVKKFLKEVGEDGFSLLELVIAVGILLILVLGGLLAYNGITANARQAAVNNAAEEVYTVAYKAKIQGEDLSKVEEDFNNSSDDVEVVVDTVEHGALRVRAANGTFNALRVENVNDGSEDGDTSGIVEEPVDEIEETPSAVEEVKYRVEMELKAHADTWWFYNYDTYTGDADNFTIMSKNSMSNNDILGRGKWHSDDCVVPAISDNKTYINCSIILNDVSKVDLDNMSEWSISAQKPGSVFIEKLYVEEVDRNIATVKVNADTKGWAYGTPQADNKQELVLTIAQELINDNQTVNIKITYYDYMYGNDEIIGDYSISASDCLNKKVRDKTYTCYVDAMGINEEYWSNFGSGDGDWYYSVNGSDDKYLYMSDVDDQTNEYGNRQVVLSHYGIIQ